VELGTLWIVTSRLRSSPHHGSVGGLRHKVPEVTPYFWVITVLATTVGKTVANVLSENLGIDRTPRIALAATVLVVVLTCQLRATRYVPALYWASVMILSVVGAAVGDNLTDHLGLPPALTTPILAAGLAVTFAVWYLREGTLSIHRIVTRGREAFYWLAVLMALALGTAAANLASEQFHLGDGDVVLIVTLLIVLTIRENARLRLHPLVAFWTVYVLTRPLGASLGDVVSRARHHDGLGLGSTATSAAFLAAILALVGYLSVTRVDETRVRPL
jgi:uncharacterized membrane-anchored protein